MENNIFEGAKFGDTFITVSNIPMIYVGIDNGTILMCRENQAHLYLYDLNGKSHITSFNNTSFDIVSRYQEPSLQSKVDENKLDELANNSLKNTQYYESANEFEEMAYIDGYFDGYRKAIKDAELFVI